MKMEKLRFDFVMTEGEDEKSANINLTSIGTPDGKIFGLPDELQNVSIHTDLIALKIFSKVRNILKKKNKLRKVWITLTENLRKIYLDEDQNLHFQDYFLEEITEKENETENDKMKQVLEEILNDKQQKSEIQNFKKMSKNYTIDKFDEKISNAIQWINEFDKECERLKIEEDRKKIEILKYFLEKSSTDWYTNMILKFTVESDWCKWKKSFCDTFGNKGWSPIRYAFAFKYQTGSLVNYALKKENLLLQIRKKIETKTMVDLIAVGLPNYVSNRIDRETLHEIEDLYYELSKLEHLVKKNKNNYREKYFDYDNSKNVKEKKSCKNCENEERGKRFHSENLCWFNDKDKIVPKHIATNSVLQVDLNTKNQKLVGDLGVDKSTVDSKLQEIIKEKNKIAEALLYSINHMEYYNKKLMEKDLLINSLNSDLNEYNSYIQQTEKLIQGKNLYIAKIVQDKYNINEENSKLKTEIQTIIQNFQIKFHELEAKIESSTSKRELENLQQEYKTLYNINKEQIQKMKKITTHLKRKRTACEKFKKQIKTQNKIIENLTTQIKEQQLQQKEMTIEKQRIFIELHNKQIDTLELKLKSLKYENDQLKNKNHLYSEQIAKKDQNIQKLQEKIFTLTNKYDPMKNKKALKKELETLRNKNIQLKEQILNLEKQSSELSNIDDDTDKQRKQFDETNKSMIKLKTQNKSKNKEFQKHIDLFRKIYDIHFEFLEINAENNKLKQTIMELEEKRGNLQLKLVDAKPVETSMQGIVTKLIENPKQLQTKLEKEEIITNRIKIDKPRLNTKMKNKKVKIDSLEKRLTVLSQMDVKHAKTQVIPAHLDKLKLINDDLIQEPVISKENIVLHECIKTKIMEKQVLKIKLDNLIYNNIDSVDRLGKLNIKKGSSEKSIEIVELIQEKLKIEEFHQKYYELYTKSTCWFKKKNIEIVQMGNLKTINDGKKRKGMINLKIKIYNIEKMNNVFIIDSENFNYDYQTDDLKII